MSARAVASATISFGLISVPTKIFLAAAADNFSFNQITKNGNRVKQKLIDAVTEEEVVRAECLKGYEHTKDQYVTFSEEEVDSFAGEKANTIELTEFVEIDNFNPVQVEKSFYLAPDKGAEKTYQLLCKTMTLTNKVAVGKFFNRGKDNLVMLKATGDHLTMFQMFYAAELRAFEYQFSAKCEPNEKEIALAKMLIKQLTSKSFDVANYHDEFAERVRGAIEFKLSGNEIKTVTSAPVASAFNLLDLLEKSLKADNIAAVSAAPTAPTAPTVLLPALPVASPVASVVPESSVVSKKTKKSKVNDK